MPVAFAAEYAPVFERKDRLHRLSEEWIQSIIQVSGVVFPVALWKSSHSSNKHQNESMEAHKPDLIVWGVSFDQPDRDRKWLLQHQRTLPTLSDADFAVSDLYKVPGIPALVLIGKDGKVNNYWEGEVSKPDVEAAIQQASRH